MLFADTTVIVKININKSSEYELSRHPYIGKYFARGIIQYRNSVNEIRYLNELKINGIITGSAFEKVKKYLMI
jgi:DNA uptake protein ComE-like DNA-binding protein